jgi:hypothetical protein
MATLTVTLTYPDGKAANLRDKLCLELGYQADIDDGTGTGNTIPNPETKSQFIQRMSAEFLSRWIKNMYQTQVRKAAADLTDASLDIS